MKHHYEVELDWHGDLGRGTAGYRAYARDFECRAGAKPPLAGSADPHFRGDPARWNPEELLVASLSACHQLWYLHLCADAGVVVRAYRDRAEGTMIEATDGAGEFASVTLRPRVSIAPGSDPGRARALHAEAAAKCFIARSVAFPVRHEPQVSFEAGAAPARSSPSSSPSEAATRAAETIDRYCAVWSCAEPHARAELLGSVWGEGAAYTDPTASAVGAEALLAHIARVRDARPGMTIDRQGPVDVHRRTARFRWRAIDGDGRPMVDGLDAVGFRDDGRLASVVGFFDGARDADGGGRAEER